MSREMERDGGTSAPPKEIAEILGRGEMTAEEQRAFLAWLFRDKIGGGNNSISGTGEELRRCGDVRT